MVGGELGGDLSNFDQGKSFWPQVFHKPTGQAQCLTESGKNLQYI